MTVKELGEKCKDRKVECEGCPYTRRCESLTEYLEDQAPYGLLGILEMEI